MRGLVAESADRPRVRRAARADADAVATLMYESSSGIYDRYAGGRRPALRVLRAAFRRRQTTASAEVVTVAELDGRVVGMIAAFPVEDASARAARFLRLTLSRLPPWRWRETVRVFRLGASAAAPPPPGAVYVDALATTPRARRRGVATALVEATVREARLAGREWLALETETTNEAARALYRGLGFEETESRPPRDLMPGFVSYVKELRPASSLRP